MVEACSPCFHCIFRIHTLAGTVDSSSDPDAMAKAEETYITNLKFAANECAQVCT